MEKKKVFVIMPFTDKFFEVYEMLKMQFGEHFVFSNANDEGNQQNIVKEFVQPIYDSDIVIADLTGLNPNVMYELGLAHSFNKKTIVITQDDLSCLPFDLKSYRAKDYSTHFVKFNELVEYLKRTLYGAIDGTVSFSNPVKDFLANEHIDSSDWFSDKETIHLETENDKGFIDFLADIESDSEKLASSLCEIGNDIQKMSIGIKHSNEEINRIQKNNGKGNASFIRKEMKKVSNLIDDFSRSLRLHNKENAELWDKLERSSLGLLENKYATNVDNHQGLRTYIQSLITLKTTSKESQNSVVELSTAMNSVSGLERNLNQSIRFVNQDLNTFISFIDSLNNSIDKIVNKSKYVIGDV